VSAPPALSAPRAEALTRVFPAGIYIMYGNTIHMISLAEIMMLGNLELY